MTRPRARIVCFALAVTLTTAHSASAQTSTSPSPSVQSGATFTFPGRGWGHGLGMSQYGAKGLADAGWDARRILGHFYSGTTIGTRRGPTDGSAADQIRVGLFQNAASQRLTSDAAFEVVAADGTVVTAAQPGQTVTVAPAAGGGFQVGAARSASPGLYVRSGGILSLPDLGTRYRTGVLELNVHEPDRGLRLRGILTLGFEAYLYGIAEVPSSWPAEALRAQAVAARTYALEKASRLGQHRPACNCAVYASVLDQAYVGYDKEAGPSGERWRAAVDDTRGTVVLSEGEPVQAFYSSSSGGGTEDNDRQWGGTALPYLRGVCDPGDDAAGANPNSAWTVTLDEPTLRSRLRSGGVDVGVVQRVDMLDPRGVSGRVVQVLSAERGGVRITGTGGSSRLSGDRFRSLMGMRSNLFAPAIAGAIRGRWDALACAPGHASSASYDWRGIDGSAWGRAQDFTNGRLFLNASSGKVWWNWGGILARYDELRRAGTDLGGPASDETAVRGGRAVAYERGRIYWSPAAGAHAAYGGILEAYLRAGGPDGSLGLPRRDEEDAPGGRQSRFTAGLLHWNASTGAVLRISGGILDRWESLQRAPGAPSGEEADATGGRAQSFTSGRLTWNARLTKVFWTYGGILAKWDALRRSGHDLGAPATDETAVTGGRLSQFTSGRIYWGPQTGAHVVYGGILERYLSVSGPDGRLGLPVSDEYAAGSGRRSDFQGGSIVWDPANGARVVSP